MKWVIFHQTPYDRVRYITDELVEAESMSYRKFMRFIFDNGEFYPINYNQFLNTLACFDTILLNCDTGEWEIKEPEFSTDYTFEELYELNEQRKEKEANRSKALSHRVKNYINETWKLKRRGFNQRRRKDVK